MVSLKRDAGATLNPSPPARTCSSSPPGAARLHSAVMGESNRGRHEPGAAAGDEIHLDLDARACPTCRRDLHPWESECPDCREPAVLRFALPPLVPAPPAHLVDEEPPAADGEVADGDGADAEGAAAEGAALIARVLAETREETREPTDVDGPPQPPPVGGDPHFG